MLRVYLETRCQEGGGGGVKLLLVGLLEQLKHRQELSAQRERGKVESECAAHCLQEVVIALSNFLCAKYHLCTFQKNNKKKKKAVILRLTRS